MADDKSKAGAADRARVNVNEAHEFLAINVVYTPSTHQPRPVCGQSGSVSGFSTSTWTAIT